ncbi:thioredoxin domain-containing protein [Flavobacterium sp. ZS1P70]|uniref:Thioredoxin domain-containing protein n=1 Tax=Flavobacterium zhoui TaxID=3230414 RepID=A0ABW6I3T6_9FLAO
MKYRLIFLLLISFAVLSCNGQTSKKTKTIEPAAFAEKIAATPNAQILDVRTPEEFISGHIDNAANVNWNGTDFVTKAAAYDKTKPVFVYCKSGGRSKQAAAKLEELGFTTIYELQGGMLKWDAAGLSKPTDKIIGMCSEEYSELLNTDKKVLINFYAEWCAPCKKMTPYILQMQKELADKVRIVRLNADENKTLISEMKISELPTLLLYENKEVKWKHSGFISEEDLKKQLQ